MDLSNYKSTDLVEIMCNGCEISFTRIKRDIQRYVSKGLKQYCSSECRNVSHRSQITCLQCSTIFSVRNSELKKGRQFCGQSCSAIFNNTQRDRNRHQDKPFSKIVVKKYKNSKDKVERSRKVYLYEKKCLGCDTVFEGTEKSKYCTLQCQQDSNLKQRVLSKTASVISLKRYLIKTEGHKCWKCNNTEWNDLPITLEIEHVDGNSDNNDLENLSILCPNCHSQTPTYKAKNVGNGRHSRRKRYEDVKSY